MRKFHCILFLVLAVKTISAQVPGYQGKRFAVGYNASSFFYFSDFSWGDGISGLVESTRLSYKTEVKINYVLSRKVNAGFSYYFAKQKASFVYGQIDNNLYMVSMYPKDKIAPCKLSIYEFHLQIFKKNFIAPVGLYNQFSIGIVKYSLGTSDNKLTIYNDIGNQTTIDGPIDPFTCIKLGYAIGKNNPLGHNFFMNTSLGVNFFQGGDSDRFLGERSNLSHQDYFLANFNHSLRWHNFLEIKIGIGWLAF